MASVPTAALLYAKFADATFIGISGLIGAGKSTLAGKLASAFDIPLYKEPVEENEYLTSFYENPEKYGFAMQVYLLSFRF